MSESTNVETLRERVHTRTDRLSADDLRIAERLLESLLDETRGGLPEDAVFRQAMEAFGRGRRKYRNALRELAI